MPRNTTIASEDFLLLFLLVSALLSTSLKSGVGLVRRRVGDVRVCGCVYMCATRSLAKRIGQGYFCWLRVTAGYDPKSPQLSCCRVGGGGFWWKTCGGGSGWDWMCGMSVR